MKEITQQYMEIARTLCTSIHKGDLPNLWPSLKYSNLKLYGKGILTLFVMGYWGLRYECQNLEIQKRRKQNSQYGVCSQP